MSKEKLAVAQTIFAWVSTSLAFQSAGCSPVFVLDINGRHGSARDSIGLWYIEDGPPNIGLLCRWHRDALVACLHHIDKRGASSHEVEEGLQQHGDGFEVHHADAHSARARQIARIYAGMSHSVAQQDRLCQVIACISSNSESTKGKNTFASDGTMLPGAYARMLFDALEALRSIDTLAPLPEFEQWNHVDIQQPCMHQRKTNGG